MVNISKIVLAKSTGGKVGYVLDVAIDFSSMKKIGYYVVDEESEGEFLIENENILNISSSYIVIESPSEMKFVAEREGSLLGKEVLDEKCFSLGKIENVVFQKNKLTKIVTDKCEILPKFIKSVGKDFVFAEFKRKRRVKSEFVFPRVEFDLPVHVESAQIVTIPERVRLSAGFYIGKICGEDIFGYNNEKIVLKDEIITKSIVDKAKKHNKLNQLFFAIKR